MATTTHLGITLVEQSQAQKEITVNQAFTRIDAILNTSAISRTNSTPPGSPATGEVYIVGAGATDDWTGKENQIAYYDQLWRFIEPGEGMLLWVADETLFYMYDGASWVESLVTALQPAKQILWIPAAQMRPSVTNGCSALAQVEISAGQPDMVTLDFNASTEQYAQFPVAFRKGWDKGTVTAICYWSHPATTVNFNVVWGVQAVACSDTDAIGASFGTAQTVTDTGGTTNAMYVTATTADITIGGTPAEGDVCFFRIFRKAADASDTLAVNARLHGIKIIYGINNYSDE